MSESQLADPDIVFYKNSGNYLLQNQSLKLKYAFALL